MLQNELKAMLNEEECIGVPADEEYQEYLIDYILDENLFENELSDYCVFPIGYNQSIIYIKSDNPLTGGDRRFRYNMIPKCYGLMASEALEETGVLRVRRSPQLGYRGGGTLVAIIDTGIKLDDSLFLYEDGSSKVVSLWDQSDQRGTRPEGFLYGTEWTREEINNILQSDMDTGSNRKDEKNDSDNISSNSKNNVRKLPNDENGHGTFLAAIAAGREDIDQIFSGVAPDAELVVVKLKQSKKYLREFYSIPDGVWSCQEDDVMLAVRYVINVANKLGKPISICLGIGTNLGGHNGANSLERYISYLSLLPKISFHLAGGNEGISGHHFHGTIRREEQYQTVDFNVAEGENGFVMELWGDEPNVYTIGILSPGGENIERMQLKMGEFRSVRFFPEDTLLEIRSFSGGGMDDTFTDIIMPQLENYHACILDVRQNGGGNSRYGDIILQSLSTEGVPPNFGFNSVFYSSMVPYASDNPAFQTNDQMKEAAEKMMKHALYGVEGELSEYVLSQADNWFTMDVPRVLTMPVIVLTSDQTGSAADTFAAKAKIIDNFTLMGLTTHGATGNKYRVKLPDGITAGGMFINF